MLRLVLNFVPTPKAVPYLDHIAGVEAALTKAKLPRETSQEIKTKVSSLFRNTPKPDSNVTTTQQKAISQLGGHCHPESRQRQRDGCDDERLPSEVL